MRYEKKMLILSGVGKGVVLMERSALGVKFALRTFSIPPTAGLKVGVVARNCVVVRELPSCADPSLVFYIDDSSLDLSYLHFAVFDNSLKLYGAIGKRMWEANIMDLLTKADRMTSPPPVLPQPVDMAPLPPPVKNVLPDPDGSGNPQLRAVYGDDLIAGDNYYTPFDISARMKEVDGFLDTPRILDGLAPVINGTAREERPAVQSAQTVAPAIESAAPAVESVVPEIESAAPAVEEVGSTDAAPEVENTKTNVLEDKDNVVGEVVDDEEEGKVDTMEEAAAVGATAVDGAHGNPADCAKKVLPWEREAEYLKTLCSSVEVSIKPKSASTVKSKDKVKKVREATFFERCRADVDKLFSSAAKDGELNMILPDIDWVKVPFDGHSLSVGRGGDLFLCYAIPGKYEKVSPFGRDAQWLPKHKNAPTGRGYWLIFQDLKSGGIICG
ncbi:MAG: hypothetical protein J1G04_03210 [Clostridiales bacterium]|nr:hypothetical protein [Clostridiales bacterium]